MSGTGGPGRLARGVLGGGVALTAVIFGLLAAAGTGLSDAMWLAVLTGLLPALSVAQLALLPGVALERTSVYVSTIASLAVLGVVSFAVGVRGRGPEGLGLVVLSPEALLAWTVGLTAGALAIVAVLRAVSRGAMPVEAGLLRQLIPRTSPEKGLFVVLSVAAGLGEELAYRGFYITALAPVSGPWAAAVVGSAVFGVLHVYQGRLGMARAGLLGGLFAWGFLASGSLWPAILAHFAVDVVAGLALGDWLAPPPDRRSDLDIATVAPPEESA